MLYFDKNCESIFFRSLTLAFENMPKTKSIGLPITEKRSSKKWNTFWRVLFQQLKKSYILNFVSVKYFGKHFLFLKIWVNYCGNCRPSNLLFCFTGNNLENLITQTKGNSCKLTSTLFWKLVSKVVSGRSFKIFDQVSVKWRPLEIFVKLNGEDILLAFSAKFKKSKTCDFTKMYNFG